MGRILVTKEVSENRQRGIGRFGHFMVTHRNHADLHSLAGSAGPLDQALSSFGRGHLVGVP